MRKRFVFHCSIYLGNKILKYNSACLGYVYRISSLQAALIQFFAALLLLFSRKYKTFFLIQHRKTKANQICQFAFVFVVVEMFS